MRASFDSVDAIFDASDPVRSHAGLSVDRRDLNDLQNVASILDLVIESNECESVRQRDSREWKVMMRVVERLHKITEAWPVARIPSLDGRSTIETCTLLNFADSTQKLDGLSEIEKEMLNEFQNLSHAVRIGIVDPLNAILCANGMRLFSESGKVHVSAFSMYFDSAVDEWRTEYQLAKANVLRSSSRFGVQLFAFQNGGFGGRTIVAWPGILGKWYWSAGAGSVVSNRNEIRGVIPELGIGLRYGSLLFDAAGVYDKDEKKLGLTLSASHALLNHTMFGVRLSSLSGVGVSFGARR
ncbi:MAG: hypothetical protein ABI852_05180 [Gemmatimonadaceae bacterium]